MSRRLALALTAGAVAAGAAVGVAVVDRLTNRGDAPCPRASALAVSAPRPDGGTTPAPPVPTPSCTPTTTAEPSTPSDAPEPASTAPPTAEAAPVGGPDTTGTPDGVELTPADAGTYDEDGLVLDGVHIEGDLTLTGANQVLRGSRVEGHVAVRGTGQVVEDSELGSLAVSGATSFTVRRTEVFGERGKDGIHVTSGTSPTSDVVIEQCWIHSPQVKADSHYDGIQVRGVTGLTLRSTTIDLGPWRPEFNAAVFLEDANGGNSHVLVEGNVVNGGGYSLYVEGTDVALVGNRFGPDSRWGVLYPDHDAFTATDNTWAADGAAVELP